MSHATRVNESCHTCEWVLPHVWKSLATHVNESHHIDECERSLRCNYVWHDCTYVWRLFHVWHDCNCSYVWQCERSLRCSYVWHDCSYSDVTRERVVMCGMTTGIKWWERVCHELYVWGTNCHIWLLPETTCSHVTLEKIVSGMQSNVTCSSWRSSCLIFTVRDTPSLITSCVWLCHIWKSSLWMQ